MSQIKMTVAVPWSLSHYIPLNGFHPLYRALFDAAPGNIALEAWDNVKLQGILGRDIKARAALMRKAFAAKRRMEQMDPATVAGAYNEYFWPPNQVLTRALVGDVEFHHTAPFPSLERPFVFHCESFAPVFLPFAAQGGGEFEKHAELRQHYRGILANPLCLGIFSHIPETLNSLSRFFSDPAIDAKLRGSRMGLSAKALLDPDLPGKTSISRPKFLFVNSANQNPANFFLRGGHLVLRFWKEFRARGRDGLLMLRCARPIDKDLLDHGVDASFVNAESGVTIIWAKDYLANHEMNALMASAHFFLLPSASLHSVSIMQAMSLGTIPVVTDTVGTSVYVSDDQQGIVLQGVRAAIWHTDPNTGVLVDRYDRNPALDDSLVNQLCRRIMTLIDAPDAYEAMRQRGIAHASTEFSGEAFSQDFWRIVSDLYLQHRQATGDIDLIEDSVLGALNTATLKGSDWARVFESPTQPIRRVNTGQSVVWELGGAAIHAYGNPRIELNDWSVLAQYYSADSPQITFANSVVDLGGKHLAFAGEVGEKANRKLIRLISKTLMPFPEAHSFASDMLKKFRRYRRYVAFRLAKSNNNPDVELVMHGVSGYNVIRYFHKYHAIPQGEGEFSPDRVAARGYSSCFSGTSADSVLRKIAAAVRERPQPVLQQPHHAAKPILAMEGFHGFNIIQFGEQFHAILQSDGKFIYEKVQLKQYSRSYSGDSLAEVMSAITTGRETSKSHQTEEPATGS